MAYFGQKVTGLHQLLRTEYARYLISHIAIESCEKFTLEAKYDRKIPVHFQITYTSDYYYLKSYTSYRDYRDTLNITDIFPTSNWDLDVKIKCSINHKKAKKMMRM